MQFEDKIKNILTTLDAEKQAYEQEEWAKIVNSTLNEYRLEQEKVCNEGIAVLQSQRDAAIEAKRKQLYDGLMNKSQDRFSAVRAKLNETLLLVENVKIE